MTSIELKTSRAIEAVDVTDLVAAILATNAGDMFAWISTPHTTAALILCENDLEMLRDIERVARGLFASYEPFEHHRNDNPNAAAHLFSSMMGTQLILPVTGAQLGLGTWQRLIFVELDGPRTRRIDVAAIASLAI